MCIDLVSSYEQKIQEFDKRDCIEVIKETYGRDIRGQRVIEIVFSCLEIIGSYKKVKKKLKQCISNQILYLPCVQETIRNKKAQEKACKKIEGWQERKKVDKIPMDSTVLQEMLKNFEKTFLLYDQNEIIKKMRGMKREFKKETKELFNQDRKEKILWMKGICKATREQVASWMKKWENTPK